MMIQLHHNQQQINTKYKYYVTRNRTHRYRNIN